ncbi:MAG: hypothetical protein GY757_17000 [bacterium]|nr:hypothetical protein [bacterium]
MKRLSRIQMRPNPFLYCRDLIKSIRDKITHHRSIKSHRKVNPLCDSLPPLRNIINRLCIGIVICFLLLLIQPVFAETYFQDTDHQLEVIKINGEKPGLTVLIFGGIHGDEPGGYFSSEILSKIKLIKGNLIIVPRVNFPSIMMNRREVNGDMNRKFVAQEFPDDPDAEVIKLLKNLMKEADIFINQHDAYGFHREKYISKTYNKSRYGQSLIIDTASFYSRRLKKQVQFAEIGQRILKRVNKQIKNEAHHFGFWDHNSLDINTKQTEMKKSATYYALTTHSIPAFGLETSKDLPTLHHKVKYQLLVIKEILNEFGFEFIFPATNVVNPKLYWVEFLKNGTDIIRVNGNTNLRLKKGDHIVVKKIYSNYNTGLSANILKWGSLNDINKEYEFKKPVTVLIKKNHLTMGKVYLKGFKNNSIREINIEVNGKIKKIPNWGKIELKQDTYIKIVKTGPEFPGVRFDVRGYSVPGKKDDSNLPIYANQLQKKYSFKRKGSVYFVKIYNKSSFAGGFQVEVN